MAGEPAENLGLILSQHLGCALRSYNENRRYHNGYEACDNDCEKEQIISGAVAA